MPNSKGFSHVLVLLAVALLVGLTTLVGFNATKQQPVPAAPSNSQYVLKGSVLGTCSSGGLSTWNNPNKTYQGWYTNETFQQLANKELLKDVSQLKDLTCLQYLDIIDTPVKGDIKDLKNLTNLEVLSLYSTPDVSGDICSLADATKLRILKFAFNPKITGDISCLKNLTKLETFAMTHTNIKGDISVFASMPNLKAIYVSGTYVKGDICSLKNLTNLQELGIADEYPGNPDIAGDLGCLDNLKKLKRVAIYNTKTTNCEAFTKSHQGMEKTITESGKQGGGGCSKESMKTVVDYAQKFEAFIPKEVQTEVRGQPNYNKGGGGGPENNAGQENNRPQIQDNRNFFQKLVSSILGIFGIKTGGPQDNSGPSANMKGGGDRGSMPSGAVGPGGCKSQAECDAYCDKQEHRDECSKFTPK
ncbi:hypothetical protein M1437_01040 [Patescibacteria group bacterium]|nr:hypothetical protein [Patescibacteria group bacterium]